MKEHDLYPEFNAIIRDIVLRVPFLSLKSLKSGVKLPENEILRPDWLAEVHLGNKKWKIIIEGKRSGQPRYVRQGIIQLKGYMTSINREKHCYGVLMAPFISERSARICTEAGIGYVDLAGNVHLSFDQVFIDIRTSQNPFKEKRELRSLFTPKSARILKVLLTPPIRVWKVKELVEEAGVSLGHVSNMRKRLIDQELARAGKSGLRLTRPEETARAFQESYKPHISNKKKYYSVLHGDQMENAYRKALTEAEAGEHAVLSSFSAARWIAPYARQAANFFYADAAGIEILVKHLQLEPETRGENVVIEEPREDDVFTKRIEPVSGIWCTGLVQTWLDLSVAGERGKEAAEHLLQQRLLPAWKETE